VQSNQKKPIAGGDGSFPAQVMEIDYGSLKRHSYKGGNFLVRDKCLFTVMDSFEKRRWGILIAHSN